MDDSESASVTAIRNAKAEQLKALAESYKADAAYDMAQAALKNAEAEYQANQTAEAKAKFVYEIEAIKAQYESAIMQHDMMKAEWLKKLKAEEDEILSTAVENYTTALSDLNTDKKSLLNKKMEFTKLQIDSASLAVKVDNYIAGQNKTIEEATAQIELLKAYDGETLEALEAKMDELVAEYKKLSNEKVLADDALEKAKEAQVDAKKTFQGTTYREAKDKLKTAGIGVTAKKSDKIVTPTNTTGGFYINVGFTFSEADILSKKQTLKETLATAKKNLGAPKAGDTPASGVYATLATYEAALKTAQDALAGLAADATADAKAAAEKAVEDAEIAVAKYKEDMHDGQTNTIDADGDNVPDTDADGNILYEPMGFAYAQKEVADAEEDIAEFEALLATVAEGSDAQKEDAAAVEAYLAAVETWIAANDKCTEINEAIAANGVALTTNQDNEEVLDESNLKGECKLLYLMSQNAINPVSEIATLEESIATAKANIEKAKATFTAEDFEAILLAEIEALEAEIAIEEELVAKYKAEVEALLTAEA